MTARSYSRSDWIPTFEYCEKFCTLNPLVILSRASKSTSWALGVVALESATPEKFVAKFVLLMSGLRSMTPATALAQSSCRIGLFCWYVSIWLILLYESDAYEGFGRPFAAADITSSVISRVRKSPGFFKW